MTKLQQINLSANLLDDFPDVSNVGGTLRRLYLYRNSIAFIPTERIASLKALSYLDLRANPLLSLPNLCYISGPVEVLLNTQPLVCDWRMAFVKRMESVGKVIFSEEMPHCKLSSTITTNNWTQITITDMISNTGLYESEVSNWQFWFAEFLTEFDSFVHIVISGSAI